MSSMLAAPGRKKRKKRKQRRTSMRPSWCRSSATRPIACLATVGLFLLGRSAGAADLPGLDPDRAGRSVVVPIETQHLGWNAAVPTYLIASYVAVSRLHD